MMTEVTCLEIGDVSYAYGAKTALKEVTFTVLLVIFVLAVVGYDPRKGMIRCRAPL
jgi:hypothetical protein